MARVPESLSGVRLDERFFDAVLKRAGGHRLTELYVPPKDTRNVDYLSHGWAIELKVLTVDPLEAAERQKKIRAFIRSEFPRGPLNVTVDKQEVRLSGEQMRKYWIEILGIPIQRALRDAEEQIVATRTFVPTPLPGMLLLVNTAAESWGWPSFVNLVATYLEQCPGIDAVVAIEALAENPDSKEDYTLHTAYGARDNDKAGTEVWGRLATAMATEIEIRTKRPPKLVERGGLPSGSRIAFQFGADGTFSRKPSKLEGN